MPTDNSQAGYTYGVIRRPFCLVLGRIDGQSWVCSPGMALNSGESNFPFLTSTDVAPVYWGLVHRLKKPKGRDQ